LDANKFDIQDVSKFQYAH